MSTAEAITTFFTLFLIIDPIALVPIFIAITHGMTRAHQRAIALRACLIGFALLTLFGLAGDRILSFIGISMPAFRIAGGILLFLTALDMLFERRTKRREKSAEDDPNAPPHDPSVFPLATPLIAGPGAFATMILLAARAADWTETLQLHAILAAAVVITFFMFLLGEPLSRVLGRVGIQVLTRLMGMLLAALAVQFVVDGIIGTGLVKFPAGK